MVVGASSRLVARWRARSLIAQVPLTIVAFVFAFRVLPLAGTVLLSTVAFSMLFAVNRGPLWGWTSSSLALLVIAPVAAVCFVLWEQRVAHPLLPLRYFRQTRKRRQKGELGFGHGSRNGLACGADRERALAAIPAANSRAAGRT